MDKYLNAEPIFEVGTGHERKGRVVKCAKGTSGEPIGRAHANTLFNTREYVVEFTDGSSENYFANVIAECMYAQVDSEGNQYQLLSEITDHRTDHWAIQIADSYKTSRNGSCVPKSTTRGWSLLVSWKDGSSDWVPLKDLKDYYPIQIAVANKIAHEPVFHGGYTRYNGDLIASLQGHPLLGYNSQVWHMIVKDCHRSAGDR